MFCWSGSPEGKNSKWEDLGIQVLHPAISMISLDSSFATFQVFKIINPEGKQNREVKWKQGHISAKYVRFKLSAFRQMLGTADG